MVKSKGVGVCVSVGECELGVYVILGECECK